jgi:tetratricopeptide (TPR) repeat protein
MRDKISGDFPLSPFEEGQSMRQLSGLQNPGRGGSWGAALGALLLAIAAGLSALSTPARAGSAEAEAAALMQAGTDAIERGVYDRAAAEFSNALDSGGLTAEGRALAYHHRAVALQKAGQQDAAISDYTKAIGSAALPDKILPKAYYNRGIALANAGQEAAAERDYLEATRLVPDYAAAYHNLANLERRRGDYAAAIGHYTAAIGNMKGRDRKLPLFGRALSFEQNGQLALAANDLQQALDIDPEFELAAAKLNAISPMLAANDDERQDAASNPRVVSAALAPFQTGASGQERGQIIRVASIGGWRTTATRFPEPKEAQSAAVAETSPPPGELITGSLRHREPATELEPLRLAAALPAATGLSEARYRVQLGAFREAALASRAWAEMAGEAAAVIGGSSYAIQKADLGDRGTFYRLRAGEFELMEDAKSACRALEARKIACFVVEGDV